MEDSVLCIIDSESFFSFTKNTWIGDLDISFHITNNDTGFYDVIDINKLVKGSSGSMPTTKKQTAYEGTSSQ